MVQPLSFRDISASADWDYAAGWRTPTAFRPTWAVLNDQTYGGPEDREKHIINHLNDTIAQLLTWREPITRVQRVNTRLYAGRHYATSEEFNRIPYARNRKFDKNHAKLVLNYLGNATDQHVSDMTAYEPNLEVSPANDDEQDKVSARMAKRALDHYSYLHSVPLMFQTFHRRKKIHGETFLFVDWDQTKGEIHPKYKALLDMRQQMGIDQNAPIPLVDPDTGEQIVGDDHEPLFITESVRVGDVILDLEYSERVLYPYPESALWDDVPYIHRLRWVDVDEVKARWPECAEEIKSDGMYRRYMGPHPKSLTNKVCVRYTYHKPTRFLDQGWYAYSTETCLLEEGPKQFNHDYLPCIRGTDIDVPGELTGMSFYQNLASLNYAINNSTSMILQNQSQFAYPKYTAPRGAKVKFVDLNDDRGIYEYSGPVPPQLVAANSTPGDTWKFRDVMANEFQTLSQIFKTSQGQAPNGITANVALRMIDESERKFHKPAIDKHGSDVERLGVLTLATLSTYRDPSDGALIQVLGKNNERYLDYFDVTNLSKPYIVHLQRSSGLPDTPAAKTQTVLDLADRFDGLWSPDEVLEYLDIHRPEKLIESATISRQSAESEVEDILSGIPVDPPSEYHDILPKYRVYAKAVQSRAFDMAPPPIKQAMLNHIITAEYLIAQKMRLNPNMSQQVLAQLPNFPMFFPIVPPAQEPMVLAQGIPPPIPGAPGLPIPPGAFPPDKAGGFPSNAPDLGGLPPNAAGLPAPLPGQAVPPPGQIPPQSAPPQPSIPPAGAGALP